MRENHPFLGVLRNRPAYANLGQKELGIENQPQSWGQIAARRATRFSSERTLVRCAPPPCWALVTRRVLRVSVQATKAWGESGVLLKVEVFVGQSLTKAYKEAKMATEPGSPPLRVTTCLPRRPRTINASTSPDCVAASVSSAVFSRARSFSLGSAGFRGVRLARRFGTRSLVGHVAIQPWLQRAR